MKNTPNRERITFVRGALIALGAAFVVGCQSQAALYDTRGVDAAAASEVNIDSLTAVVKQNPSDPAAYNLRGTAFGRAGKLKEAMADFETAIKLNPSYYQAYANRALVHRRMGNDGAALADYNQAIQINPTYDVAYAGRANLYRGRGQLELALADFNRAI